MGKYTFVTESHLSGDDKQTVEILSKAEIKQIAQDTASQAIGQWQPEFEQTKERLAKRIEQARKSAETAQGEAEKAEQAAIMAGKKAKTEANRLVEAARASFRDIVAESLAPLLGAGLKQVLDNQAHIRQEHESLKKTATDLALKIAAVEANGAKVEKGTKELQARIETLQADVTAIQRISEKQPGTQNQPMPVPEAAETKLAELFAADRTIRDEIEALRAESKSARDADMSRWAAENKKLRADMTLLSRKIPAAGQSGVHGGQATSQTNIPLWCMALLGVVLGLCGLFSGRSENAPQADARPKAPERGAQVARVPADAHAPVPPAIGQGTGGETAVLLAKARAGGKDAQSQLGTWVLEGRETGATENEAVSWVLRACADRKDRRAAIAWLEEAARQGNKQARNTLTKLGINPNSN